MCNKYKVLGVLLTAFLYGCTGNSGSSTVDVNSDIKRFSGVVNNSSVIGADVAAIPIGKHGQFALNENNNVAALTNTSDEKGKFGFSISVNNIGPYVLTVTAPEFDSATEAERATKMGCQVVAGCSVNGQIVSFGGYYAIGENRQWSAAVQTIENGQFIVINPITEMAKALGYTEYVNQSTQTETTEGDTPAANYYSNYNIAKSNSQTASLLGLGDILSKEPANLALLHELNVNASTSIEESIRYGALLAAWQQLELEYEEGLLEGELTFQQQVIKEYLVDQGQLYQSFDSDPDKFTLKKWYQTALDNLIEVQKYHRSLNRALPSEIDRVKARFVNEISIQKNGEPTTAKASIPDYYVEDYTDAVMKTKAMVNYISNLQSNFATAEYRDSIKESSDLITEEVRRLSPKLDVVFDKMLSVYRYYLSCTHAACDVSSEWHGNGNVFTASTNTLIIQSENASLNVSQGFAFDVDSSETTEGSESTEANVHDLFMNGSFEFDDLRLELSDLTAEDFEGSKSSIRFAFPEPLSKLPLEPEKIAGGNGATVNEDLVPDYVELLMPKFKLYDTSTVGTANELEVTGALTALMIANVDAGDTLEGKSELDKLGKRYNLSSVKATLILNDEYDDSTESAAAIKDNALFFLEATASESFISTENMAAYFPDTKYPKFENFFKPREGFEVGNISSSPLVISRTGTMDLPELDSEGNVSETEVVQVQYIELDYEIGGLDRYIVYPKIEGENEYWGLVCAALPADEAALEDGYFELVFDEEGAPVLDSSGNQAKRALLSCPLRDKYEGDATPNEFINQIYALNNSLVNLREYNGYGSYRINYPETIDGALAAFSETDTPHKGTLEQSIVLGVDSMRLQFKPNMVNPAGTAYLPESILDVSLTWRTLDTIDVNAFLAFDTERVINNPNGTGIPYLAVGSDSESYSIAYRTDGAGNESGEYVMAWSGVKFVDGAPGTTVMQRTDIEDEKEGVFAGIGSNVSYGGNTGIIDKECGFFSRSVNTESGEKCDAIAYFTFRGLVTGSLREERDGVYVIRYIDGTWQILGE